jgi:hypothetical protein
MRRMCFRAMLVALYHVSQVILVEAIEHHLIQDVWEQGICRAHTIVIHCGLIPLVTQRGAVLTESVGPCLFGIKSPTRRYVCNSPSTGSSRRATQPAKAMTDSETRPRKATVSLLPW